MVTKQDSQCLANAKDDEPIFVLRAQDVLAPETIRMWASLVAAEARHDGLNNPKTIDKIRQARKVADEMEAWAKKNGSKIPD